MKRLLIVEDDDAVREFLIESLSEHFEVEAAADGLEGLNLFELKESSTSGKIDMLLSDMVMPNMDGLAMIKEVQNIRNLLPTVIISGDPDIDPEDLKKYCDLFFTKPVDPDDLVEALEMLPKTSRAS